MANPLTILAADEPVNPASGQVNANHGVNLVGNQNEKLVDNVTNILNGVIAALGLVAVIIIVIGGVSYMTSSGDPGKTKKAKDTILYGVIGLIICVLSFAIVNFVIKGIIAGDITGGGSSGTGSSSLVVDEEP